MNSPDPAAARLHLRAAAIALALVALCGVVALLRLRERERRYLRLVVAEGCEVKDQGIVWQREYFAQPDVLPIYGSSELVKRAPNKASQFFESYPTGFAVSPVGRPSCTSLILLEKIAAAAPRSPGRKIAICISPSWFTARGANSMGFDGNFSRSQAMHLFYSAPLSLGLKRDIAVQLLRYPQIIRKTPLLAVAVWGLASDHWFDRGAYFAALPLGWLQNAVSRLQDHYEVARWARDDHKIYHLVARQPMTLDWNQLLSQAAATAKPPPEEVRDSRFRYFDGDAEFLQAVSTSLEWTDLDLLLRVVRELGMDPLLISMPMEEAHFARMGVSPASLETYPACLHRLAARYHVPVADFAGHSSDPLFFADHYGHPSAKGWAYFNRALDDFFHGRPVGDGVAGAPAEKSAPVGE
jgi:D-alanine transfer protein